MMRCVVEHLECRSLFSAVYPTADEQYEVELINRARANPAAEAARDHIDLNEGLPAGTISTAAKQPLAINPYITDAARKHSQWMIDHDTFSHYEGSIDPGARDASAGYTFSGSYSWGENIAYRSTRPTAPDPTTTALQLQNDLFIDSGIDDRGHRTNMLNAGFKEVGAGLVSGDFNSYNAVMLTTDFANSAGSAGGKSFLTGVAFNDSVTRDNFYTVGEGLAGVTITAVRAGDNATFSTSTWSSGGYSLPLGSGTYTVTATGSAFPSPVSYGSVVIGSENVKRDFQPNASSTGTTGGGTLTTTTPANGTIRGTVFNDLNHNGIKDDGEPGIAGVLMYLDIHHDGKRNHGEPYARTNADGAYKFTGLALGVYRVRETQPTNYTLYAPKAGFISANINAINKILGGRNFADELIA